MNELTLPSFDERELSEAWEVVWAEQDLFISWYIRLDG